MKRKILTAAMIAPMLASPAYALDRNCYVPMKNWVSRLEVINFAQAQGWVVRRVRIDDGCYEINGLDADGVTIEVRVNPATLDILRMELETRGQSETEKPD